jgi:hypothetical protein
MEIISGREPLEKKIYSASSIVAASFLAGPLVGAYLIAYNYKAFNEFSRARRTCIFSAIGSLILFILFFSAPYSTQIPLILIPLLCMLIARNIVRSYQGYMIRDYIARGGTYFDWFRVLIVIVVGAVITFLLYLILSHIRDWLFMRSWFHPGYEPPGVAV